MKHKNLSIDTWKQLDTFGNIVSGYKSIKLTDEEGKDAPLHIFIDEKGRFHFAIETSTKSIEDPVVNGLTITVQNYRIGENNIYSMIDLCCAVSGYLEEFTGVIKEIAECIIDKKENPNEAVSRIIRNWKVFWGNQNKQILSEEEIIGLICELQILDRLCDINASSALGSWTGPLKGKSDFNFTSWELEVKATRNSQVVHIINGLDQLEPSHNKSLAFISYLVSITDGSNAISLPELINHIINNHFSTRPDLATKFNELLSGCGYNPSFNEQYRNFKIEFLRSTFYIVDDTFPKFTAKNLISPLNSRISKIRYVISLQDLSGTNINEVNWGNYFY